MRTALLTTALLTTQAMADTPPLEDMWTAYTNWCSTVVNDPDTFFSNVDLISQGVGLVISPSENGDVIHVGVVRPSFSFDFHVGHVQGRTFFSCGVSAAARGVSAAEIANRIETEIASKVPPDAFIGGKPESYTLHHLQGSYGTDDTASYENFLADAVPGVETLTFIQAVEGYVLFNMDINFEGRVGLPTVTPERILRIP